MRYNNKKKPNKLMLGFFNQNTYDKIYCLHYGQTTKLKMLCNKIGSFFFSPI